VRVLTVRERDLLPFAGDGRLSAGQEQALGKLAPMLPRGALTWERGGVRVGPFSGIVRAGDLVLEILPKIEVGATADGEARGVLVAMLRAAADVAVADAGTAPLGVQRRHLLDVFILDFCARVAGLLRGGAIRTYRAFEDDLPALRGRLRLAEQVRRMAADRSRFRCGFDELTPDNPHNRALKAVLGRLLHQAVGPDARAAVGGLLHRLAEVSHAPCSATHIDRLPFNRLTETWRPVFQRAGWFLRGLFPDVRVGGTEGLCLLFDMQRLFEAFVGACLRREWRASGANARVVLQGPSRHFADSAEGPAFRLRPDAAVVSTTGAVERLLDAKWKRLDPGAASRGVAREDAYQLAAYAGAYRCTNVALVYPRLPGLPAGLVEAFELRLPGRPRIEVFALDLGSAVAGGALPEGLAALMRT
jgi:5-methylcytosine-specific restriction enzyme subunit McrC